MIMMSTDGGLTYSVLKNVSTGTSIGNFNGYGVSLARPVSLAPYSLNIDACV